jgi:hypothetical protein
MKIVNTIFAIAIGSTLLMTACKDSKTNSDTTQEHGHEHDAEGNHFTHDTIEQEEFIVDKDSLITKEEKHTHDDGSKHHDH